MGAGQHGPRRYAQYSGHGPRRILHRKGLTLWIYLTTNSEDSTSSPGSEESPKPSPLGSERLPIVKMSDTPKLSYCPGCHEVRLTEPRSGMTCEHCNYKDYGDQSTSSPEASPVRTLVSPAAALAWEESVADYSSRSLGLWASYDRALSSWKMSQQSLFEAAPKLLESLPRWGMTVAGACFRLTTWERRTKESVGGCLPTLSVSGNHNRKGSSKTSGNGLSTAAKMMWPTPRVSGQNDSVRATRPGAHAGNDLTTEAKKWATPQARDFRSGQEDRWNNRARSRNLNDQAATKNNGKLSAIFAEWLMGYRLGATALNPSATVWFRNARGKRSGASQDGRSKT